MNWHWRNGISIVLMVLAGGTNLQAANFATNRSTAQLTKLDLAQLIQIEISTVAGAFKLAQDVTAAPIPGEESLAKGAGTILVVEDKEPLRELAALVLRDCGHEVLTAHDGFEGLSVARTIIDRLNLILMDVIMPQMGARR